MASMVFGRAKKQVKAKAYDAEGNEVAFDVRADEEQNIKRQEIIDLLLAAGYFRARIKTLSDFDKVVGGMTWCITASNIEVDADLLFQENSTIGQKIALTEKIVAALPRMKCPHRLEPHQIQGLDFKGIFPVVQWLVKKAISTREERAKLIRQRALFQFHKTGQTPQEVELEERKPQAAASTQSAQASYQPRRQYKAPGGRQRDAVTRVQTALLEYGRRHGISRAAIAPAAGDKGAAVAHALTGEGQQQQEQQQEQEQDASKEEQERINKLMSSMSDATAEGAVSTTTLGSMMGAQSAEIAQLSEDYRAHAAEMAAAEQARTGGAAAHKRAVDTLARQKQLLGKKADEAAAELEDTKGALEQQQALFDEVQAKREQLDAETQRLDELEGDESNKPIIAKLSHLLKLYDSLKQQDKDFKATCKSEMEALGSKIDELKAQGVEVMDDEAASAISGQYQQELKKLEKVKVAAAKRTRQIALVHRKMDEIPSRAELTQYQRRFAELYEQVNAKHRETKQYITLYNTLRDVETYYTKEQGLLTSIHTNFPKALKSSAAGDLFVEQLEDIVGGIRMSKQKADARLAKEEEQRDSLREQYLLLVDKDRMYYKTVRDYEQEMARNEKLTARVERAALK